MSGHEIRTSLAEAEKLLASSGDARLRHVALELRWSLEAYVYEKLWAYRDRLPAAMTRKWQPPQAFKALVQLEPRAGATSRIRVARQSTDGVPAEGPYLLLGVDYRPDPDWLTKAYNKLGSYLHAPFPFARAPQKRPEVIEAYLREVLEKLKPWAARMFTTAMAPLVNVTCNFCGFESFANAEGAERAGFMVCLNPDCGIRYILVEATAEGLSFRPDAPSATCQSCGADFVVPPPQIVPDALLPCPACKTEHRVRGPIYEVVLANPRPESDAG